MSPELELEAGGEGLVDGIDDAQWTQSARAQLNQCDEGAAARFDARLAKGPDPIDHVALESLLRLRAECVDAIVLDAWSRSGCAHFSETATLALFAVGGYGRGELFPRSDVDLLVLADADAQHASSEALSSFFALLWDTGLKTGHAVRSLIECTQVAASEITAFTAMLEARQLAGDPMAAHALQVAIEPPAVWPAADYFFAKRSEQTERHARFNDTAYNLEPNLKEGPGGLRDVHTLAWMARRVHAARDLTALVPLGLLGEDEYATLEREHRALSWLRFGLHLVAGRAEERLLFDHQKALAQRLGYRDEHVHNLGVEQMMQGFFRSAARVLRINERLLQRFEEQIEGDAQPVNLDDDFVALHGYLAFRDESPPDASRCLRLFAAWAANPQLRGLHSRSARALAEALPRIPAYPEATPPLRAQFIELLRQPGAVDSLARMARLGVLGRYLPDFGRVSGRMQYDLFHVFTVDAHTLAVLRHMQGFARRSNGDRFSMAADVHVRLRKPMLLLLAGLFHDIAKGRSGDHSQLGAVDAMAFCSAHALATSDGELVAWLVAQHLLMSLTAQKQDISDPAVINRFAERVADREHLDYLYLLTCADIAGTSPKLWNGWKDRLLADLYAATRFALRRGLEHPVHATERIGETRVDALASLLAAGLSQEAIEAVWAGFPDDSFLRYRADQIVWQTSKIITRNAIDPSAVLVAIRRRGAVLASSREAFNAASLSTVESSPTTGLKSHAGSPIAVGAIEPDASQSQSINIVSAQTESADVDPIEVFVHARDRDGLFAAAVATLDRLGLDILEARVLGRDGFVFDGFQVLPVRSARVPDFARITKTLRDALANPNAVRPVRRALPRQLRHFRIPVRAEFTPSRDFTHMTLIAGDRPGLLADVARVLRDQGLRVHDARIATFGERVEDFFLISDVRNHALDESMQQALRAELVARIDGASE